MSQPTELAMNDTKEIIIRTPGQITALPPEAPSIAHLLAMVVQGGITDQSVGVMEKLLAMQRETQKDQDRRDYASALASLQAECRPVKALSMVPNRDGSVRYKYASTEDIMREVSPLLAKYGFSIQLDAEYTGDRITALCTLTHSSGCQSVTRQTVRVSSGPPGASTTQADCGATTTARRYALCGALGIVIETREEALDDVQDLGDTITLEEASELRRRTSALGASFKLAEFFTFAGSTSFEDIPKTSLPSLLEAIAKKERQLRQAANA